MHVWMSYSRLIQQLSTSMAVSVNTKTGFSVLVFFHWKTVKDDVRYSKAEVQVTLHWIVTASKSIILYIKYNTTNYIISVKTDTDVSCSYSVENQFCNRCQMKTSAAHEFTPAR